MLKFLNIFFKHATGIKFATYQKFSVFGYVLSQWLPEPKDAKNKLTNTQMVILKQ